MTSNQGGGTHPGDPWSPDWQPATPEETPEDEWPYDESLTLSDAELEIAGLEDDADEADEAAAAETAESEVEPVAEVESELAEEPEAEPAAEVVPEIEEEPEAEPVAEVEPEVAEEPEPESVAEVEPEVAEEPEPEPVAEVEPEVAEEPEPESVAEVEPEVAEEPEPESVAEVEPEVAEEPEPEPVAEVVPEIEEEPELEPVAEVVPEVGDELAAEGDAEPDDVPVDEAAPAAVAAEPDEAVDEEVVEPVAAEIETDAGTDVDEPDAAGDAEPEEVEAELVDEVIEVAGVAEPDLVEEELLEGEVVEAEVVEVAAIDDGDVEIVDADILAVDDLDAPEPASIADASDASAVPGEAAYLDDLDEVAQFEVIRPTESAPLHAVDDVIESPVEEISVEDLQGEPEWLEAVEEMTLDDIADEAEPAGGARADEVAAAEVEPPWDETAVTEPPALPDEPLLPDQPGVVIEDANFEVVDIDDADLRADTAEHFFEALNFETDGIDPEAVTAEVPIAAEPTPGLEQDERFEYDVPDEYDAVAADVDANQQALAAFMAPAAGGVEESSAEPPAAEFDRDEFEAGSNEAVAVEMPVDQLQILPGLEPAAEMPEEPAAAATDTAPEEPDLPVTPEEELIASLTGDLTLPDFETFVEEDFSREFVAEPTQEHRGLAESIAESETPELSAVTATMPGVDHGHVGFQEFDDDLHFEDPDAPDDVPGDEADVVLADVGGSDLTLRVASAVVLVALLAGTLWAGGVTFLIFIAIVAVAAQIEFYAAVREGGYRPLVLFGLLGGLGALIGTYAQSTDALSAGPVAVPAAIGLTVIATFAWYGSQEKPPRDPWRNGMVTVLGVAWIPATLAFVLPMAEASRSDRLQIVIVLLIAVAGFDVGSYFVGRALGKRKLSPVLSPNKTVEGLVGGVVATLIVAVFGAAIVDLFTIGDALALAVAIIVAAPLGDLAESLVKRSLGIKDMGQLIPGHGGVLDRIDSYLFAVPVAYLVLRWTGLL